MKYLTLVALVASMTLDCKGQTTDAAALRAEVASRTAAIAKAVATFVDKTKTEPERLKAVENVSLVVNEEQVKAVAAVLRDEGQPVAIRVKALGLVQHRIDGNDAALDELMAWLRKPNSAADLRVAAADFLRTLLISSQAMAKRREDIMATLRAVASDPDQGVREIALSTLAGQGDDFAEQLLIKDLADGGTQLLPPETAVALLALNPDGDTIPALRQQLTNPASTAAQTEAVRVLGGDPPSRDKIVAILQDKSAPESLRIAAAGTLNANTPDQLPQVVLPVVTDESTGENLRIYGIKAVQTTRAGRRVAGKQEAADPAAMAEFDAAVAKLAGQSSSSAVRAAAQSYETEVKPKP